MESEHGVGSDHELVELADGGDPGAFERLYLRHRDWAHALAFRFTGDPDDALDVLQDAFSQLFDRFPGFVLTGSLRSFLYPVVKHLALDRVRRRRPSMDIDELAGSLPAPAGPSVDDAHDLSGKLARLGAEHREVLLLRFVDGLTLAEIAHALGLPVGTAKSRLHYALAAMRES